MTEQPLTESDLPAAIKRAPALPYQVIDAERDGRAGHTIVLKTGREGTENDQETILGIAGDPTGKNRAYAEYITLRLNRAFVNGWYGAQGVSSWPDQGYYDEADRLFKLFTQ